MFDIFKRKKEVPTKILQMAYYMIYFQKDLRNRERYLYWDSYKLNYALFLIDLLYRAKYGVFLFKNESKTFGWHGFYYNQVHGEFGMSANFILYESYDGNKEFEFYSHLTMEERDFIDDFLEGNYSKLNKCMFNGDILASFLSKETQDYLHSKKFPLVNNDILEEFFVNSLEVSINKEI